MADSSHQARKRRAHKKSRTGCQNCKRRRIKCDEGKPACQKCTAFSLKCDFSPSLPATTRRATSKKTPSGARPRGRPRKHWDLVENDSNSTINVGSRQSLTPSTDSLQELSMREMAIGPYGEDDMLLLYHYLTDTAPTPEQSEWAMWRDKVPLLAFRHPCVLHMLLAVTALRLARGEPGDAERFRRHAERHSSVGMAQATELLPHLSLENCDALYIVAILVQTYTFGKGPRPNNLFLVAEGVQVPWWDLLRGVRFVIGTMGFEAIFSGILGPLKHDELADEPSSASFALQRDPIVVIRWELALQNVTELISSSLSGPEKDVFVNMLEHLIVSFRGTFGGPDDPKDGLHGRFDVVMAWLYRLDDILVLRVGENHPVALVMLAHFGVLLHTLEYVWFMAGWGMHVVSQVNEVLGAEYAQWLDWPLETVKVLATCRIDHMADEGLGT